MLPASPEESEACPTLLSLCTEALAANHHIYTHFGTGVSQALLGQCST
jgi:hypothetical protein